MNFESDHSFDVTANDDSEYVNCCESDEDLFCNLNTDDDRDVVPTNFDNYEYHILTTSDILHMMMSIIYDVVDILNVNEITARLLMDHYNWNREDLMNAFVDANNLIEILNTAKIPVINDETGETITSECGICFTTTSTDDDASLIRPENCHHLFCAECWTQYLNVKIFEDDSGGMLSCAAYNCNALLDDTMVLKLITESKIRTKFEYAITNTFVQCDSWLCWCPAIDCHSYAIRVEQKLTCKVTCKCGYQFCFGCGEFNHEPIDCALLKRWTNTVKDDFKTVAWLTQYAKKCTKCKVHIEKNGGCNHMTCRKCEHEFCWVCLRDWKGGHTCSQYRGPKSADDNIDLISIERLKHYQERYRNHAHSLKLESKMYGTIEKKMVCLQDLECLTQNQVIFLRRAIEILCKSRQILTATYVFAYFTKKCNQLLMFEDNQRDLEIATEELSRYLEHDMNGDDFILIKQALQEKSTYCEQRQKVLLDHVREGHECQWWNTMELE